MSVTQYIKQSKRGIQIPLPDLHTCLNTLFDNHVKVQTQQSVYVQLSNIYSLHSIRIPANKNQFVELIDLVSIVNTAVSSKKFSSESAETFANIILHNQEKLSEEGMSEKEISKITKNFIRSVRNLSHFDENILGQMLKTNNKKYFDQISTFFSAAGKLYTLNSLNKGINSKTLSKNTYRDLKEASDYCKISKQARTKIIEENTLQAQKRSTYVAELISILVNEIIEDDGESVASAEHVASIIVECFFTQKIHWVDVNEPLTIIFKHLLFNRHVLTASKLLLYMRISGLIQDSLDLKFYYSLFKDPEKVMMKHQKTIESQNRSHEFHTNPHKISNKENENISLLLGFYNAPHIGHRSLAFGGFLSSSYSVLRYPILISINQSDPNRLGQHKEKRIPLLSIKQRKTLVMNNFKGLTKNNIYCTSIDLGVNEKLPAPERINSFIKTTKYRKDSVIDFIRICGSDRIDLTPSSVDVVLIGLRGKDLDDIVKDPDIIDHLKEEFRNQKIIFVIVQGTGDISSTNVMGVSLSWLDSRSEDSLYKLKSWVHKDNVELLLQYLEEKPN